MKRFTRGRLEPGICSARLGRVRKAGRGANVAFGKAGLTGLTVAAAVAALGMPAGASAAVQCGDTLTKDVKLKQDLDCSGFGSNALNIGHNGVDIDLNGHRLIGPASLYHGINGPDGYDRLTIRDGTIEGFYHAIDLVGGKDVKISHLTIELGGTNDDYGIYVGETRRLRMSRITIHNADYGFYLYGTTGLNLRHSKVSGGEHPDFYSGVYGSDAQGTIDDVKVKKAEYAFYLYSTGGGYEVTDSSANKGGYVGFYLANADAKRYVLRRNTANNNETYGFYADKRPRSKRNRAKGNGVDDCFHVRCK
jgi:hypothetical protein